MGAGDDEPLALTVSLSIAGVRVAASGAAVSANRGGATAGADGMMGAALLALLALASFKSLASTVNLMASTIGRVRK